MSVLAAVDLNWLLQFVVTVFLLAFGLLHVVKNTASKYFLAEDNDNDAVSDWSTAATTTTTATATKSGGSSNQMMTTITPAGTLGAAVQEDACAVCGNRTKKKCSGCKMVMYCSEHCQRSHWRSEHKKKCKDFQSLGKSMLGGSRASSAVSSFTPGGSSKIIHQSKKILFPYEEFVELFNWDKPGFPPCGLLNCGNSCFANVVLQCLAYTRPLIAFLLEKGHRRDCRRNDWCFLCEFQLHVQKASQSLHPFSPINILSRLPNIGGNLGYGKQEDAHEFMRFAIDTMQSVCLDEFGGEKAVHPTSQKTTIIQHIFGGHLQSQVICTKCGNVSNQFENMMDLTVEIHGDAASLEECLDQFTAKEWLHGDNMYRCDGCNDYVMAWKRLSVRHAPNILTIALKRFQSGRFGKLNKRVTFPETLDLNPYMSEAGEENNIYKLYAVIVHVDMLNASFFGHYICYVKDFCGKWYRIDDCKVTSVDIDDVLSQGAYMLLYSRIRARSSCLYPVEPPMKEEENVEVEKEIGPSSEHPIQCCSAGLSTDTLVDSVTSPSDYTSQSVVASCEVGLACASNCGDAKEDLEMVDLKENLAVSKDYELPELPGSVAAEEADSPFEHADSLASEHNAPNTIYPIEVDVLGSNLSPPRSNVEEETGSRKSITQENLRHSSDQDFVATQNHFYKEGVLEPFSEYTVQCFSVKESTDTLVDSVTLPSDNTLKSDVGSCKATLSSASNPEYANENLEMVDLKENFPLSMNEEAAAQHEHSIVSSNNTSNTIDSIKVDVLKLKPSSPQADVEDGIGGSKSIPKDYSSKHLTDHDPEATQNHVYGREEMPLPVSAAMTICNEVLERTKTTNSKDETGRAGRMPSSNRVQGSARKEDGKRSGAKVKPLFPPGFLEKRPKNKNIKREDRVSAEIGEQISGSNVNCKKNGVSKPDPSCQIDVAMTNGNRAHFGHHDNGCASILGNSVGMHEKDTHMLTGGFGEPSGFDEPSRTGHGSSKKPIILDDNTTVNTDERMLVAE